jgi:HEPN domain-containing protein
VIDSLLAVFRLRQELSALSRQLFGGITEQRKVAFHRREDAQRLYESKRWRGAMYLAGYSVECLFKAKLMQLFGCQHLRELEEELQRRGILAVGSSIYTHQLELLLRLTHRIDAARRDQTLWKQFAMVNLWLPAWRYNPDLSSQTDAEDFLQAVDALCRWIESNV